jgi:Zn-dependent peptidase ImmA (M78 family)
MEATVVSDKLAGKTIAEIRQLAREDAQTVLDKHWQPNHLPVDPIYIARSLGASVFKAELGEDTWGMLVGSPSGLNVYLDRDQPRKRYRFSCAHEVGHIVDRGDDLIDGRAIIEKRSDVDRGRADEIYANEFAGSLLMPEAEFRAAVAAGEDVFDLSDRFDVSLNSVAYRRRLLGI